MAFDFQVAIDCSSPHVLADWWAEALGWEVEAQDEAFIRRMVDDGLTPTEEQTTVHRGALVWREGAAITSPEPGRPRVLFQEVPEPKSGKNRLHLDVRIGPERQEAEVGAAAGAGRDGALARLAGAALLGDDGRPRGQRVLRGLTGPASADRAAGRASAGLQVPGEAPVGHGALGEDPRAAPAAPAGGSR